LLFSKKKPSFEQTPPEAVSLHASNQPSEKATPETSYGRATAWSRTRYAPWDGFTKTLFYRFPAQIPHLRKPATNPAKRTRMWLKGRSCGVG